MIKQGGLMPPAAAAAASGLLFWLAAAPHGLWPLALAGCGLLAWSLLQSRSFGQAILLAALSKLCMAPTYPYLAGVTPAVQVLYALNQALGWCAGGAAFYALRRGRGDPAAAAAFPFLWVILDWYAPGIQFLPSGLTSLASPLGDSPLRALAPYVGVCGVTLLASAAGTAPVWFIMARSSKRRTSGSPAALTPARAAAVCGMALALGFLAMPRGTSPQTMLRVTTVGLAPSWEEDVRPWDDDKLLPLSRYEAFFGYLQRKFKPLRHATGRSSPDLILLPEDAIDITFPNNASKAAVDRWGIYNAGPLIEGLRDLARTSGAAVATGLTTIRDRETFNTVLLIEPDGGLTDLYDKTALTAGSESWPLAIPWLPYWKLIGGQDRFIPYADQFEPGTEPARVFRSGKLRFGTPICLEGQIAARSLAWLHHGADFLILLSNAQWFAGDPRVYNKQVLSLVRMTAAAYGLPVLMTGKSAAFGLVSPSGKLSVRTDYTDGPGIGISTHELRVGAPRTTAARLGEFCLPLSALVLLLAAAGPRFPTRLMRGRR